jgi:uncharacterized membrane protein
MESQKSFEVMRYEVVIKSKNGVNFLIAATVCWVLISIVWSLDLSIKQKAIFTFFCTGPMMPLAFLFSKVFKTSWKIEDNPLNDLGLWLNMAQLLYFPFVFIYFSQQPNHMVMALAIITGAHFLPFGWFYMTKSFAVMAGVISIGSAIIGTQVTENPSLFIALFLMICLTILSIWTYRDFLKIERKHNQDQAKSLGIG